MPDKASSKYRGEAAAAAFDRVLEAELTAEAAVVACRQQAEELSVAARKHQRALQEDVETRIAVWRARLAGKADAGVAALDGAAARWAGPAELDTTARDRITQAVARLADELIDGD